MRKIERQEINQRVVELVSMYGYDGCSASIMADACGITKGAILAYGHKDKIIYNALNGFNHNDDDNLKFQLFMAQLKIVLCASKCKDYLVSYCIEQISSSEFKELSLWSIIGGLSFRR